MTVSHEYEIEEQIECLKQQGFPTALGRALCQQSTQAFPLRLWIVDNSGSMKQPDGRRLSKSSTKSDVKWKSCSRWDELKDTVEYHAQMAALLQAPTQFMLLNPPGHNQQQQLGVAEMGQDMIEEELHSLRHALQTTSPGGVTPLTRHLHNVYALVSSMRSSLEQQGQRVAVVIATDGIPTDDSGYTSPAVDREFERALERLQELPVWIVVRLCTNDDKVVEYYNSLDDRLEWSLEVLDDFVGESKEIYKVNPWLTYALPLHRCREWGSPNRLLDLLDERRLTRDEMSDFLQLLFCSDYEYLPEPTVDWDDFLSQVQKKVEREERPWNPVRGKSTPWIDVRQLERCYGPRRYEAWMGLALVGGVAVLGALWYGITSMFHHVSKTLDDVSLHRDEGTPWMVAGGLILLYVIFRRPPNARSLMILFGVIVSLALGATWDKPRAYWEGIAWMLGGLILLFLIVAYNDR